MRDRLKSALLLLISLPLAVAAGEWLVRTFDPQVTFYPRFIESSDYPIAFPPDTHLVESRGKQWRFVYTTNHIGHRGPYVPIGKADSTENVVVLGDSFTFGIGVNDGEVYTDALAAALGPRYTVINGGVGGWGLDSEIKWYFAEGRQYKPRFVIVQFCANDPTDFVGVTEVVNGALVFHPYAHPKPRWQGFLSRSALIQRSNLYALARSAFDGIAVRHTHAVAVGSSSHAAPDRGQEEYVDMLRAFAKRVHDDGATLLFISVTSTNPSTHTYGYDVDLFPEIRAGLRQLDSAGMVHFVDLPLSSMSKYAGSPQGHQWGPEHHHLVGAHLAEVVDSINGS
ncbi:MAG TPA: SGNH/GDSL hydrolase family protein [Gemmatimonadaceae bacterium]|nr:SGNH/GDSL hydrolase family protein [Gemmatimonadaceae bacterium]